MADLQYEPIPPMVLDWLNQTNPEFGRWLTNLRENIADALSGSVTAQRLAFFNAAGKLISKDLVDLIAGSGNLVTIADDGSGGITIAVADLSSLIAVSSNLLSIADDGDGSVTLSLADLDTLIAGTTGRVTVSDAGSGKVTLTVPLKADYGIDSDADGLKLKQQSHEADAETSHSITDPADAPATADALRDDLVANALPEIASALDALGVKVNNILAKLETAELFASS